MNNVFGGGCNPRVLIDDTDVDTMVFNTTNTIKVVLPGTGGEPDKVKVPGSNFPTLTGVIPAFTGIDIYTKTGQDRDMTALLYGGGFGPVPVVPSDIVYNDTFTGAAGPLTGHTAETGHGVVTSGSAALDGNGNLVFASGATSSISIDVVPIPERRVQTVVFSALAASCNAAVYCRTNGTSYTIAHLNHNSNGTFDLVIDSAGSIVASAQGVALTFPITFEVTDDEKEITVTANGGNSINYTSNLANPLANVEFNNGGSLASLKLQTL